MKHAPEKLVLFTPQSFAKLLKEEKRAQDRQEANQKLLGNILGT